MTVDHYKGTDFIEIIGVHNEPIEEISYLVFDNKHSDCIVVDPANISNTIQAILNAGKTPSLIILTHEHCDHVDAVNAVKDKYPDCKILCSETCAKRIVDPRKNLSQYYELLISSHGLTGAILPEPFAVYKADQVFNSELVFSWNGYELILTETPGHSPGSICVSIGNYLFSGDSLLRDDPVVTRLPGGNRKDYPEKTVPFLKSLDDNMLVLPGHGESFRLDENIYLKKYNEV